MTQAHNENDPIILGVSVHSHWSIQLYIRVVHRNFDGVGKMMHVDALRLLLVASGVS